MTGSLIDFDLVRVLLLAAGGGFLWLIERGRLARLRRLRRRALCVRCGYDLRRTTGQCPECGARRDTPIY